MIATLKKNHFLYSLHPSDDVSLKISFELNDLLYRFWWYHLWRILANNWSRRCKEVNRRTCVMPRWHQLRFACNNYTMKCHFTYTWIFFIVFLRFYFIFFSNGQALCDLTNLYNFHWREYRWHLFRLFPFLDILFLGIVCRKFLRDTEQKKKKNLEGCNVKNKYAWQPIPVTSAGPWGDTNAWNWPYSPLKPMPLSR